MAKVDSQSKPIRERVFDSPTIVEVGVCLVRYTDVGVVIHGISAEADSHEGDQVFVRPEVIEYVGTILIKFAIRFFGVMYRGDHAVHNLCPEIPGEVVATPDPPLPISVEMLLSIRKPLCSEKGERVTAPSLLPAMTGFAMVSKAVIISKSIFTSIKEEAPY